MSHQDEPTEGAAPAQKPFSTPRMVELEAELERTRAELAATVDALTDQLDPRVQAARAAEKGRRVVQDAFGSSTSRADRARALKVLGAAAAVLGVVVLVTVRRRR